MYGRAQRLNEGHSLQEMTTATTTTATNPQPSRVSRRRVDSKMASRVSRNSDVASPRQHIGRKERELRRKSIKRAEKFYAVRVGAQPGIYQNWSDCLAQITGFPKAKYKSFSTREDAQDFIDGGEGDVRSANKWIGVRVGRVPGVYSTVREAMEQTQDNPKAEYRFFTSKEEAKNYVDPATTPALKRLKRKSSEPCAPQDDQSHIGVKKVRIQTTPLSIGTSNRQKVPLQQPSNSDGMEAEIPNRSTSDSILHVDVGDESDVERSPKDSQSSDESSVEEQSQAERSPAEQSSDDKTSSERPSEIPMNNMDLDALTVENARLKAEVQRLSRPAAGSSPGRSRPHVADVFTVLLACENIDRSSSDPRSSHPEANVTVHGVYSSAADANLAAMQAFQHYCPKAEEMKIVDLGVTSDNLDETKTAESMCQQRRTPEDELRLCWRDAHGHFGFIMVQRKSVNSIGVVRPRSESRDPHTKISESDMVDKRAIPRFCYLICEHYGSSDKLRQDGGMLAAFSSKERANAEAEEIFRKHFLKSSSEPIVAASEELGTYISTNTASLGHGTWRYMQRGRVNFFRRNDQGDTKVWVHKFEVR
jgi:viroplasmin and RNaseH domain-containing protein